MSQAKLVHPNGELLLGEVPATVGSPGYDVSSLLKETGHITLDPGFMNTASCQSAITYIDGDNGILRYRGYPIEQLAAKSTFIETSYLLIYGHLPNPAELSKFTQDITMHTMVHEDLRRFFDGFPRDAHPMPVLSSAVSALSTFYQDSLDPFDERQVEISTIRLMAKIPTLAAYAYKKTLRLWICYSFCMPITNRTVQPQRFAWLDLRTLIYSLQFQQASMRCLVRCMVARIKLF